MTKENLFQRDFVLVVVGQIISLFGNAILRFALPLYILRHTGSAAIFGFVTACSFVPIIVLSLLGGVVADRVNKRNIMVILDFSTAAIVVIFTLMLGKVPIVPLFIVMLMLLYGIQGGYQPAVQASIPSLVPQSKLIQANAVINQVSSLANLIGPVIGGVLFGTWGLVPILMISAVCFTFSAIMEVFIHIPYIPKEREMGAIATVKTDLRESLLYIKSEKPVLFKVMGLLVLFNLFLSAMLIIGHTVMLTETLGVSNKFLGYSEGALAAGGLAGGVLAGAMGEKMNVKKAHLLLLFCAFCVFPMGLVIMVHASAMFSYIVISVMCFLIMMASAMFSIQMLAFVQGQTPPQMVGKVISCLISLSMCAQPIGQAVYGFLFQRFAETPWVILFGSGILSLGIALLSKTAFDSIEEK